MDKNKLAEEYQQKVSHNCQADNCRPCYDITTAYIAGFDAAESIANAKIQELEDFRQAQVEEIKRCDSNLKLLNTKITELEYALKVGGIAWKETADLQEKRITELELELRKAKVESEMLRDELRQALNTVDQTRFMSDIDEEIEAAKEGVK